MRKLRVIIAVTVILPLAATQVRAETNWWHYRSVGGVNLNYYCQKTYGGAFKSVLVGNTAGDWTCQRNQNDRREISVENACKLQYNRNDLKARATDWNNPLSWVCMKPRSHY